MCTSMRTTTQSSRDTRTLHRSKGVGVSWAPRRRTRHSRNSGPHTHRRNPSSSRNRWSGAPALHATSFLLLTSYVRSHRPQVSTLLSALASRLSGVLCLVPVHDPDHSSRGAMVKAEAFSSAGGVLGKPPPEHQYSVRKAENGSKTEYWDSGQPPPRQRPSHAQAGLDPRERQEWPGLPVTRRYYFGSQEPISLVGPILSGIVGS